MEERTTGLPAPGADAQRARLLAAGRGTRAALPACWTSARCAGWSSDLVPARPRRANTDPLGPYLEALSLVRLGLRDPGRGRGRAGRRPRPGRGRSARSASAAPSRGAVDFDEQIYGAVELLLRDGEFRRRAQARCRHLLVDEFQDLTPAHVLLLRLLATPAPRRVRRRRRRPGHLRPRRRRPGLPDRLRRAVPRRRRPPARGQLPLPGRGGRRGPPPARRTTERRVARRSGRDPTPTPTPTRCSVVTAPARGRRGRAGRGSSRGWLAEPVSARTHDRRAGPRQLAAPRPPRGARRGRRPGRLGRCAPTCWTARGSGPPSPTCASAPAPDGFAGDDLRGGATAGRHVASRSGSRSGSSGQLDVERLRGHRRPARRREGGAKVLAARRRPAPGRRRCAVRHAHGTCWRW